jgi:hypothetical protein
MTRYTIGKPGPEDVSSHAVRFPLTPRTTGGWLDDVLAREGASLDWKSGSTFLVVPVRPGGSLQDAADRAKKVVAKVNAWVEQQERKFQDEEKAQQKAAAEVQARVDELRGQLDDLDL